MKVCPQCHKSNPNDFQSCRYCGWPIDQVQGTEDHFKRRMQLPSWAWILILVGGAILLIALVIGSVMAVSTIEGVASALFIASGIIGFGVYPLRQPGKSSSLSIALGLSFFALMGAAIDEPGNIIYNKPIELCFCTDGSRLHRGTEISNPMPGTTYVRQDFTCQTEAGVTVKQINMFMILAIRFVEYVLLGYILLAIRRWLWKRKNISAT